MGNDGTRHGNSWAYRLFWANHFGDLWRFEPSWPLILHSGQGFWGLPVGFFEKNGILWASLRSARRYHI